MYIPITNQQSSIINEMGGGADVSSFSGKKPKVKRKRIGGRLMTRLEMQEKAMDLFMKHFH
jgi:hypothetical protein